MGRNLNDDEINSINNDWHGTLCIKHLWKYTKKKPTKYDPIPQKFHGEKRLPISERRSIGEIDETDNQESAIGKMRNQS